MLGYREARRMRADHGRRHERAGTRVAILVAAGIAVASCGSGPAPSRTASVTRVPSRSAAASAPPVQSSPPPRVSPERTRTTAQEPAASATSTKSARPTNRQSTPARTQTPKPTPTLVPSTPGAPTAEPSTSKTSTAGSTTSHTAAPTTATTQVTETVTPTTPGAASTPSAAQAAQEGASGTPAWLWWLLAALGVVLAAVIIWLIKHRSRRTKWTGDLSAATGEVTWFARALLPQLGRAMSVEQIAAGWQVAAPRVSALEDRLTALDATAPAPEYAARARTVRDAVRSSRLRISTLPASADRSAVGQALGRSAAELEAALARIAPAGQQPGTSGAPPPSGGPADHQPPG